MLSASRADQAWKAMTRPARDQALDDPLARRAGPAAYATLLDAADQPSAGAAGPWLLLRDRTADRTQQKPAPPEACSPPVGRELNSTGHHM